MFLGNELGIQRFEQIKHRQFEKFSETQLGFFWQPEEVDLSKDIKDFKSLEPHQQHIFTSNLRRQILLDSIQGRSMNLAFLPIASLPEVENWITYWSFNETIHSKSYTYMIRNIYPDPSIIFDELLTIEEIVNCADDISKYYDDLLKKVYQYKLLGLGKHQVNGETVNVDMRELKKALWLAVMSVNILEGIRFYVSFACTWAFAENKLMEGSASILRFICRDENLHLGSTQTILKLLLQEKDFADIAKETEQECVDMFVSAIEQEKDWAKFLFKDGTIIGLNEVLLTDYIEWIGNKRMTAIKLPSPYKVPQSNPLPWTLKWISGSDVQPAPQEVQLTSYIIGGTKQDITEDSFKGFDL